MVALDHIVFGFGDKTVLNNISATFEPFRIHGVIGPNGSGKSTLLKNICRIWMPQAGTVYLDGTDYKGIPRRELSRMVTLVPQNTTIGFPISVYDIVSMGRNPHLGRFQSLTKEDRNRIDSALRTTQVYEIRDRSVNEISGGECQLAVIARALATEASIILLDEPTSDLDIEHGLIIMDLLADLKMSGKTILASIHDLNLARRYCDTITIIDGGEIVFAGSPTDAFSNDRMRAVFNVNMTEVTDESKSFLYFYM